MKLKTRAMRLGGLALALGLFMGCTGCVAVYVDPHYRSAGFRDVSASSNACQVAVQAEYQINGKHDKSGDADVRKSVLKVLKASKVFDPLEVTNAPVTGTLRVTLNDTGNMGAAFGKGFVTGLTFGLVGSEVEDHYFVTINYVPASGSAFTRKYEHSLHATVGLHAAPQGMERVPLKAAGDAVVEDVMLNFLRDWQNQTAPVPDNASK